MNLPLNKVNSINQKIIVSLLIFLAIIVSVYFFVFSPVVKKISQKKTEISNLKIEIIKNREKELNMDILTSKLKTIEAQVQKLDQSIVLNSNGLEFIIAMEDAAKKNNIVQTLDLKAPIEDAKNPAYKKTPIDINARGSFNDIYKYLDDLESMTYYLNIEEINLESTAMPGEKSPEANLHLLAFSYWKN